MGVCKALVYCRNLSYIVEQNIMALSSSTIFVYSMSLCESEASLVVNFEDLLDRRDVGCSSYIKAKVVFSCCVHDVLESEKSLIM